MVLSRKKQKSCMDDIFRWDKQKGEEGLDSGELTVH